MTVVVLFLFFITCGTVHGFPPVYRDNTFHVVDFDGIPTTFRPMAFVDWNGDYSTDMFGTNSNNTRIIGLTWKEDHYDPIQITYNHENETIVNLIVLDFDRDAQSDILVVYVTANTSGYRGRVLTNSGKEVELQLPGSGSNSTMTYAVTNYGSTCALLDILAVYDGKYNMYTNLAPQRSDCSSNGGGVVFTTPNQLQLSSVVPPPLPSPTFVLTVDTNGDMGADIVIPNATNTSVIEYLVLNAPSHTEVRTRVRVPAMTSVPVFEDIDADGITDMAVFVCYPWTSARCAVTTNVSAVEYTHIMLMVGNGNTFPELSFAPDAPLPYGVQLIPLVFGGANYSAFYNYDPVTGLRDPPLLRFGDFDSDSYPDLMYLNGKGTLVILRNPTNGLNTAGGIVGWDLKYTLTPNSDSISVSNAAWIDIGDDGRLDAIVCTTTPVSTCKALVNGVTIDGLFVSGIVLNGAKEGVSYGSPQVGAVQKFWYQDIRQHERDRIATQGSTFQYGAMPLPYLHFGLGRTYSYVEEYHVGIVVGNKIQANMWQALVPNSFIIVSPHPLNSPEDWVLQLFVAPTWLTVVAAVIGGVLGLLAIPICYLKYREHMEDKRERSMQFMLF